MSRGVSFGAVVRSEWTKLWSLRSTWWCTAVYLLVVGASGWLAAAGTDSSARADIAVQTALSGFGVGQLVLLVLGVLVVTGEFASGMALVSLTVVPRRSRLLVAKTLVVLAYSLLFSALLAVVCALAARTLTAVPGGVRPDDPDVLRTLGLQVAAAGLVGRAGRRPGHSAAVDRRCGRDRRDPGPRGTAGACPGRQPGHRPPLAVVAGAAGR